MKTTVISIILSVLFALSINAQVPLKLEINNIKNSKGNIVIAVFKTEYNFNKGIPSSRKKISKKGLSNGILASEIILMPGTYGIAILDDENSDEKMNYNFVGIPTEGYGFSNYYHAGLTKPKFSNFAFNLPNNNNSFKIKLRYF